MGSLDGLVYCKLSVQASFVVLCATPEPNVSMSSWPRVSVICTRCVMDRKRHRISKDHRDTGSPRIPTTCNLSPRTSQYRP